MRPTWADIDLAAVEHNVAELRRAADPALLCVVVKAEGYGHGAVPVARAAVDAGAQWLAVALVEEGRRLREAGIRAPILVLSEPRPLEMVEVVAYGLHPTVYSGEGLAAAAAAAIQYDKVLPVHLKVDTGMRRVGVETSAALAMARAIVDKPSLDLEGVWTHCAVADQLDDPFTSLQLDRYEAVLAELEAAGIDPGIRHAANSAVTLGHPRGRYDLVRCGIAAYGVAPGPLLADAADLRPVMKVRSEVSFVKEIDAGERVSYGLAWEAPSRTRLATVPIGYADGIRRRAGSAGAEVLIRGRRHPIVGNVTMDQLLVDCGDRDVRAGDEVVFVGAQGHDEITVAEWAGWLDTIAYEVVCDIESRVVRRYL
jgi:alanine racemase